MCHHASHGADPALREACKCKVLHKDEQRVYLNRAAAAALPAVSLLESIPIMTEKSSFVKSAIRRAPKPVNARDIQFAKTGFTSLPVEFTDKEVEEIDGLFQYCKRKAVRVDFNPSEELGRGAMKSISLQGLASQAIMMLELAVLSRFSSQGWRAERSQPCPPEI